MSNIFARSSAPGAAFTSCGMTAQGTLSFFATATAGFLSWYESVKTAMIFFCPAAAMIFSMWRPVGGIPGFG